MSRYTTEVRFICETAAGLLESQGYSKVDEILTAAIPKVFDFDFPIWDPLYKPILEKKILKHYYTREIGFETVGLWKLKLDTRLNEIMPRYNKLYATTVLEFNPLYDVDLTTTHEGEGTNGGSETYNKGGSTTTSDRGTVANNANKVFTHTEDSTTTHRLTGQDVDTNERSGGDTSKDLYSDTPQGALTNVDNETYLTSYRKIINTLGTTDTRTTTYGRTDETTDTGGYVDQEGGGNTQTLNTDHTTTHNLTDVKTMDLLNTDAYVNHVVGKSAGSSYSKMIEEFRNLIIDIDMMIIHDLSDLFFGLW